MRVRLWREDSSERIWGRGGAMGDGGWGGVVVRYWRGCLGGLS